MLKKISVLCLWVFLSFASVCKAEDDGVFGEVADLDLDTYVEEAPVAKPASQNMASISQSDWKDLQKIIDLFKGLSIKGLAQVQLDHTHSQSQKDIKTKSKSKFGFRRLGLLFSKKVYDGLETGIQVDFNTDADKAEIGKFFLKHDFKSNDYYVDFAEFTYDEKSFGYETSISNLTAKRVEKSVAASYFKNTIKAFSLRWGGALKEDLSYKILVGTSDDKKKPKHFFTYGTLTARTKIFEDVATSYGLCLGYIHREKTSDHTGLGSLFSDFKYGKWQTIAEVFCAKNVNEDKWPLGLSLQQNYAIRQDNTLVLGYSFVDTQNSKTAINPSQLERNAPANTKGSAKPQFKKIHAVYVGDEWQFSKHMKVIGGYEFAKASGPYDASSISRSMLHAFRVRFQLVF